jgi:cytochrome c oxidase subunit 4
MAHDAADIDRHVRTYVMVFASLLVLTGLTVGVYYLHLPVLPAIGLALVIATIKATLVACFFMHLISEKHLIFAVLLLTVMFFVVLLLLPTLSSDLGQVKI